MEEDNRGNDIKDVKKISKYSKASDFFFVLGIIFIICMMFGAVYDNFPTNSLEWRDLLIYISPISFFVLSFVSLKILKKYIPPMDAILVTAVFLFFYFFIYISLIWGWSS